MSKSQILTSCAAIALLAGCSIVPGAGPQAGSFKSQAAAYHNVQEQKLDYILVDVDANIAAHLKFAPKPVQRFSFETAPQKYSQKLVVGDKVKITIFESSQGGLFVNDESNLPGGNQITIPTQIVDDNGNIKVPFVGLIKASGRLPNMIASSIEEKLKNRAIEPQVIVNLEEGVGRNISVTGNVRIPGQFKLPQNGMKILDAISLAKGMEHTAADMLVTLHRKGVKQSVGLQHIIDNPKNNINLQPNDQISVDVRKRYFSIMGATNIPSRNSFEGGEMTVQEGLSHAHGVIDAQGDAANVVLYRVEKRDLLVKMGVDLSKWTYSGDLVPAIYRFNMKNPSGFFLAGEVPLQHKDLIYVANSPVSDFQKLNQILRLPAVTQSVGATAVTDTSTASGVF